MDDQVESAVGGPVHLDEVVAAAQGAEAALQIAAVLQGPEAAQLGQVEADLAALPDLHPGGDEVGGLVQTLRIDLALSQLHRVHPAADIHADHVGDGLVDDRHGGADGAALACVDVGHDADPAARGEFIIAHPADLLNGLVLDHLCEADRGIDFSFDFQHGDSSLWNSVVADAHIGHHETGRRHRKRPPASYKTSGLKLPGFPIPGASNTSVLSHMGT